MEIFILVNNFPPSSISQDADPDRHLNLTYPQFVRMLLYNVNNESVRSVFT
jgi:hypothetical protein